MVKHGLNNHFPAWLQSPESRAPCDWPPPWQRSDRAPPLAPQLQRKMVKEMVVFLSVSDSNNGNYHHNSNANGNNSTNSNGNDV